MLNNTAKRIEKNIYLYPVSIVIITSLLFIIILYNFLEEFKFKETQNMKMNLIKSEKNISKENVGNVVKEIMNIQKDIKAQIKDKTKEKLKEIIRIIENIEKNKYNHSKEELKKIIAGMFKNIKFFDGRGYVFIIDRTKGDVLSHSNKEILNENIKTIKAGESYLIDIIEKLLKKQNEGFISYKYQNPNKKDNNQYEKVAYIQYIKELDLIIGIGDYPEDMENMIKESTLMKLEKIRIGKNGYFWIHNRDHKLLMNPYRKKDIGRDDSSLEDIKGTKVIQLFVSTALDKKEGSFVEYYWENPVNNKIEKKISFVQYIPNWDWVIGMGVYVNDINKLISEYKYEQEQKINSLFLSIIMVFVFILLITIIFSLNLSNKTRREFQSYRDKLTQTNHQLEEKVQLQLNDIKKKENIIFQQSKLAAMGEMIGNIAHQWRQPLNTIGAINMKVETKLDFEGKIDYPYYKKISKDIQTQLDFMSKTIDDFRNFFTPNSKDKAYFSPKDVISEVLNIVGVSLKNNYIEIETKYDFDKKLYGYKNELQQVLLNIISNSKDAFIINGIEDDKYIKIDIFEKDGQIVIEISDNAGGIDENILYKIFEPYFTTKFKSQGTGIGLYMSKIIIEEHMHGHIYIQNFQKGIKAIIKLPF